MTRIAGKQHLGVVVAGLNVFAFVALLASKSPDYQRLRAEDVAAASEGMHAISSADPMYLAGRPFDSSAHVANVPLVEDLYFFANVPAMLVALTVSFPLGSVTSRLWTGSFLVSSAWQSWTLALVFGLASAAWGFAVGSIVSRLRSSSDGAA